MRQPTSSDATDGTLGFLSMDFVAESRMLAIGDVLRLSLLLLLSIGATAHAGDGGLDPTYGLQGIGRVGVSNVTSASPAPAMLVQPDGKSVLCGNTYDQQAMDFNMLVARLNVDGTPDTTFSFDGHVSIDFNNGSADACTAIARQADGKLVVAGFTPDTQVAGNDFAVARLNADGSLDTSFGNGSGKVAVSFALNGNNEARASSVMVQGDGRIVAVGLAVHAIGNTDFAILRLLPDGSRDPAFNLTGRVVVAFDLPGQDANDNAKAVTIDAQNRILVAGVAGLRFAAVRLLSNGTLDGDFDSDGRVTVAFPAGTGGSGANAILLQGDSRIVLAGYSGTATIGTNLDFAAIRLLPDASLDESFGFLGQTLIPFDLDGGTSDVASSVLQQSDGKIVAAGYATATDGRRVGAVIRLQTDGELDPQFGSFGRMSYDFGFVSASVGFSALALQGSQLVAAGTMPFANNTTDLISVRLQIDLLFANGFE